MNKTIALIAFIISFSIIMSIFFSIFFLSNYCDDQKECEYWQYDNVSYNMSYSFVSTYVKEKMKKNHKLVVSDYKKLQKMVHLVELKNEEAKLDSLKLILSK